MWRRLHTTAVLAALISALLFASFFLHLFRDISPRPNHDGDGTDATPLHLPRHRSDANLAIAELHRIPPGAAESVLLPGYEVLILLPPGPPPPHPVEGGKVSCVFQNGATAAASAVGVVPSSGRAAYHCLLPDNVRRLRPFYTPRLTGDAPLPRQRRPLEMARWNRLAYEAVSTPDDVIVLAKGVNGRQGAGRRPSDLRCAFLRDGAVIDTTAVTSSAQEVFRCPHPPPESRTATTATAGDLRVSIHILGQPSPIQSLATYHPPPPRPTTTSSPPPAHVCACTMVYNVAKFLPEWVTYHSAIGVERFILYDNGSEDELDSAVSRLARAGHNVSSVVWPWAKAQEAGFSHCAATHRDSCTWMAFLDVDEFLFAPSWAHSTRSERWMAGSLLPPPSSDDKSKVGQVTAGCLDFGASGRRHHPAAGVTQGYTCRQKKEERHKAVVRLEAVANGSLVNQVHHFGLDGGWRTRRLGRREAVVNHYKYQAWEEFRAKFRRRVSAFVSDWTEPVNPRSQDRTPGLGYRPVEPPGWEWTFCEVNDTRLREVTRRWFGVSLPPGSNHNQENKMTWED